MSNETTNVFRMKAYDRDALTALYASWSFMREHDMDCSQVEAAIEFIETSRQNYLGGV